MNEIISVVGNVVKIGVSCIPDTILIISIPFFCGVGIVKFIHNL